MANMVVSASTGVLSSLLSKLSILLSDQYKQRKGVRRDIELLSYELTYMNAALEKLADMEKLDGQTKVWRDNVREMGYDIEDCIDIFMHHLGQEDDVDDDDGDKDGLFHKIGRKIKELRVHYQLANKIQALRTRVEEQSQSRDRYMIEESVSQSRVVEVDPRLPALFEDAKRLVGMDGPVEEINKLMDSDTHFGQLKVVSIVGFGGLGKTTLANQVHNKIKNRFECAAFVSVSRIPDMPSILKGILSKLGYAAMGMEDNVQKLIEMLRAQLSSKRYLVIIDDLWSTKDWRTIECVFVENNNGSRIITTTRIQDVATACCFPSQGHVYQMQPLNELHSRRLFFTRLFYREDGCPEQLREISDAMLRKCKGVPLAITSIASLLSSKHLHLETWEKIHNSLGHVLDTNPTLDWMRHVLTLSYNDLSHELKTCLLYLGAYPEDHAIRKNDLVRKWIAEGFVLEMHGADLEEAAENCFNELINRSMIQPCFHPFSGEVWGCQVHDLMLDLIVLKCKDENFITIIDRKSVMNGSATQVRRISHQFNQGDMNLAAERFSLSQVRSYNTFHLADCMPPFSKFELLRVLDMERSTVPGPKSMYLDLSAIDHLFLLRYLRVSRFLLGLPKKFGKLKHLMTLDMSLATLFSSDQQQSVSDLTSLSALRHLRLPVYVLGGVTLTNRLSKLCNLRTLSRFTTSTNTIECIRDLGELTNLRELGLIYSRPDDVEHDLDTILAASLDKLGNSNLRYLVFEQVQSSGAMMPPSTQFLSSCFTRPQHLQRLCLDGLIPKVPNWMVHANRLAYLYKLEVQELWSNDIQVLAQLPCLIYLWLIAKTVPEKNIIIHPNTFPSLKDFHFSCDLSCLMRFEPAAMPRLQRLDIRLDGRRGHGAMQLKQGSPVCGVEHLASLVKIEITVEILAEADHGSKIEAACRDAISRHPRSEAMQIHVSCNEFDGNGFVVARQRGTAQLKGSVEDD